MFKAMQQRIRQTRQDESGFTLIELLIVIVILGVLAGIVVFAVGAFNNDGKAAACKSDVKNVEIAQEAFYAKQTPHVYAASVDALVTANYLKEAPDSSEGIATGTTGVVTHTCSTT
jgi:general secretion pathway protein G